MASISLTRLAAVLSASIIFAADRAPAASDDGLHCELHGQAFYSKAPKPATPPSGAIDATDIATWKTISIGTFESIDDLRGALRRKRCRVGPIVADIMGQSASIMSRSRERVGLAVLSVAELGLRGRNATLGEIYARAASLGLELCPAEIGPQLRLQYMNQPLGEFLHIAMEPVPTRRGPMILVVANGGEGLLLISSNASADTRPPASARFVFVQPQTVARR